MTIEEKLRELILSRYKSLRDFVQHADMSYSTVDSILRRGIANSSLTNIFKLCKALNISADELANNMIVSNAEVKDDRLSADISELVKFAKMNVQEYESLTLDGKLITQEELEVILDAIDIGIEIVRRKKRRDSDEN